VIFKTADVAVVFVVVFVNVVVKIIVPKNYFFKLNQSNLAHFYP